MMDPPLNPMRMRRLFKYKTVLQTEEVVDRVLGGDSPSTDKSLDEILTEVQLTFRRSPHFLHVDFARMKRIIHSMRVATAERERYEHDMHVLQRDYDHRRQQFAEDQRVRREERAERNRALLRNARASRNRRPPAAEEFDKEFVIQPLHRKWNSLSEWLERSSHVRSSLLDVRPNSSESHKKRRKLQRRRRNKNYNSKGDRPSKKECEQLTYRRQKLLLSLAQCLASTLHC